MPDADTTYTEAEVSRVRLAVDAFVLKAERRERAKIEEERNQGESA